MNAAAKVRLSARINEARGRARELSRTALYWARDARRNGERGDRVGAEQSYWIAVLDRDLAQGWRAELRRLEALR